MILALKACTAELVGLGLGNARRGWGFPQAESTLPFRLPPAYELEDVSCRFAMTLFVCCAHCGVPDWSNTYSALMGVLSDLVHLIP